MKPTDEWEEYQDSTDTPGHESIALLVLFIMVCLCMVVWK
jgi:hypothetical protein